MKIWWKISYFVDKKKNSVREQSLFFLDLTLYKWYKYVHVCTEQAGSQSVSDKGKQWSDSGPIKIEKNHNDTRHMIDHHDRCINDHDYHVDLSSWYCNSGWRRCPFSLLNFAATQSMSRLIFKNLVYILYVEIWKECTLCVEIRDVKSPVFFLQIN